MMKSVFIKILITISSYFLSILLFKENYYIGFGLIILVIDKLLYKNSSNYIIYLLIPALSIVLFLFDNESILRSARFIFIFPLLLLLSKLVKNLKLSIILSVILLVMTHLFFHPNWASYYRNQLNSEKLIVNDLNDLRLDDLNFIVPETDTYILDLWYTKCAACYTNMKEMKDWVNENSKYSDNIILVNILLDGENYSENRKIVDKYGFYSTFSYLSFEEFKKLGVKTYPTQIVIKNNKIVFVGDLELNKNVILNNINDYLN